MSRVASIVEGDGEVQALPVLLRRISEWRTPDAYAEILTPIRVRRDRFLNRDDEFHNKLQLAAAKCGEDGWILLLLDADDDCPAQLATGILARAQASIPHRRISVVLANREYEAWFIAAARSLAGRRGLVLSPDDESAPESLRNAKGWLGARMGGYHETLDQSAFSACMDMEQAFERSRSFRKLCSEWIRQMTTGE